MPYLAVSEARLFVRIHSFTIACPVCGDVWRIGNEQSKTGIKAEKKSYNRFTQEWRCPQCRTRFVLGALLWTAPPGLRIPQVTSLRGSCRNSLQGEIRA